MRQTDRQTNTTHHFIMPPPYRGREHKKKTSSLCCLPEVTMAHSALCLAMKTQACPVIVLISSRTESASTVVGQPCHTWFQKVEADTGLSPDVTWKADIDRHALRARQPLAGQVNCWIMPLIRSRLWRFINLFTYLLT